MRRWVFAHGLLVLCAFALGLAPAAHAQTGSLTFDPPTVMAGGGKLFINGSCDPNSSGTLISEAFAGQPDATDFAGVPALAITTGPDGTFGIGLTISPTVPGGSYNVSLRCGGALAASGTLTVVSFGAGAYVPVTPERLLDTRSGIGAPAGIVAANGVVELTVTGVGAANVPADASAVCVGGGVERHRYRGPSSRLRDGVAVRRAPAQRLEPQHHSRSQHSELGHGQDRDWWPGLSLYPHSDAPHRRHQRLVPSPY
jgi:hypothetical protein